MNAERWELLKSTFSEALELPAEVRGPFLEQVCARDSELGAELRSLLDEHDRSEDFLVTPAVNLRELAITEQPPRFAPGAVLARRFEISRFIARGGMGEVYEARDLELGQRVALKTIRQEIAGAVRMLDLFKQEIQFARRVTHPNVCRIFDFHQHTEPRADGAESTVHFLTMEFLGGEALSQRMRRVGPFSPAEGIPLVQQMVAALQAAHSAEVIHRDFKPGNVMLVPQDRGDCFRVVVTDFGVARPLNPCSVGDGGTEAPRGGTPDYMAPEQLAGGPVSPAVDIYSLGLVIADMVGGRRRYEKGLHPEGPEPASEPDGVVTLALPSGCSHWWPVLRRCLERLPEDRFTRAVEVLEALQASERARRLAKRRRAIAAIAACTLMVLLLQPFLPERFQVIRLSDAIFPGGATAERALSFQARDWVLITRFENRTGENALDGVLEYALERDLGNSRYVNVAPPDRVGDALRLMRLPLDTPIDIRVGREVCQRDGAIRGLLAGRVDKVGGAYDLGLEVVNPSDGEVVASRHTNSDNQAGLLLAIQLLSDWARQSLGEALAQIKMTGEIPEKVTTSSLQALKFYSLADKMIPTGGNPEPLLREAIALDPSFASAENLLAWALRNAGKPKEEFLPHAVRARELSANCTPRERYFIEASFYGLAGDRERARAEYETLLRAFPDHHWAANNLAIYHLNRGEWDQALHFLQRASDLRPNVPVSNLLSALVLVQRRGDVGRAADCAARARRVGFGPWWEGWEEWEDWTLVFPIHRAWVEGNIDEARAELIRLADLLPSRQGAGKHRLATYTGLAFLMLGEFRRAEKCFEGLSSVMPAGNPPWEPIIVAVAKGEPAEFRQRVNLIMRQPEKGLFHPGRRETVEEAYEFPMMLFAQAGYVAEVEKVLRKGGNRFSAPTWGFVRGELALAKTEYAAAADQLGQAIRYRESLPWHPSAYFDSYFMGAASLAVALEHLGRMPEAIRALEDASALKARTSFPGTLTWGVNWLKLRSQLADLYRKAGRVEDALRVEDDLMKHLVYADPGHPILTHIDRVRRSPAAK